MALVNSKVHEFILEHIHVLSVTVRAHDNVSFDECFEMSKFCVIRCRLPSKTVGPEWMLYRYAHLTARTISDLYYMILRVIL